MQTSERLQCATVTQAIDYGQFYICCAPFLDPMPLLEAALSQPPCAGDGNAIVVVSPQQWNFQAKFRVEIWSGVPPQDSRDWDQVSLEALNVRTEPGVWLESATVDATPLPLAFEEVGYNVEVCGRESNADWDVESASEPNFEWRLRFWPHVEGH
ncbi:MULTISPECIES: hypothetical protein [unclassified Pseudoclavibacter]|uniref:hypothetical protein n=1 Tax=unclassified Pseudoclavibacter TaxID=2615177 RepID=UPI000CE7A1B5|nr:MULTISPECIES: hypothetical protein [unclassified Pseudoclavibacter]MBS3179900.1 hypothetical protein [Pseudoclavibacter sp. Marseille-Q4354]PPG31235.1 hypothetical protein C5B97_05720 [Pseudoclavibacter sp. RFBB5]